MVIGIVAEYNPFHNGHKYQLDYAKDILNADYIVVAMSGYFTQRGSISCMDKHIRAQAALENGADLIFEIPTVFSCSSAREYASAAIELLYKTSVVDTILFGIEEFDENEFINACLEAIEIEASDSFDNEIKNLVSSGLTYAQARNNILNNHGLDKFINSPNNILGYEYIRYIKVNNLPLNIKCCKRINNEYHAAKLTGTISSATSIRNSVNNNEDISLTVPTTIKDSINNNEFINENSISDMLYYKLISTEDFAIFYDCNPDISDRINKLKSNFISYSQFTDLLKSKNITYTRASRILCHILLGITWELFETQKKENYISILRLLGFSQNGSNILHIIKKEAKEKIITNIADTEYTNKNIDLLAASIFKQAMQHQTNKEYANELTRKFNLVNIKKED